ncbi:UNVERIFIED_CONTAM: hypothetical protein ABIC26_002826 [Paenibacillus sp. PvR008]
MKLVNLIPKMTSNTAPEGKVTYSTANGVYYGYKAFDGDDNTFYGTYRDTNTWVCYTFTKPVLLGAYSLYCVESNAPPNSWVFEASNNETTWVVLDTKSNYSVSDWKVNNGKLTFTITTDEFYTSYRVRVKGNNVAEVINIYGIEMMGFVFNEKFLVFNESNFFYYDSGSGDWKILSSMANEQSFLDYGMNDVSIIPESAWSQLQGEVELCYYTDNPNTTSAQFIIEAPPFTLAEIWKDKEISIIEYTDDPQKAESTVTLETEPFTLYDELGDNIDVLYYTDELTKTTASLEYTANYSPLDDISNNYEVVTWTDESNNPLNLSLGALPVGQFIKQSDDFTLPGSLQAITVIKNASDNAKFLLSFDSGLTWKSYRYGKWIEVIDDMNAIKKQAMSYKEISKLVDSNFKNQGNKIKFGYYIEDKKQESLNPTKIDVTQLGIKSNVDSTKFQNLSFYVLNTEATIQLTFNSGKILGQIYDEDKGKVQYRVLLNDLPYFPNDGTFTRLAPSPVDINLNISERDMYFDKDNKLRVEFKDYWGKTEHWETTFAGTYTGLMFMDGSGEYLSDTFGGILKYLDFGMIFAGQTTLDQKVVIKNQLGYPIDNLLLEVNKEILPKGVTIELSRTQSPFLATDYITYGLTNPLETQEFYVRIVADIEAKPVPNGIFELKINSNKAV